MPSNSSNRLVGIDFAYTLAVIGCVLFCFTYVIPDRVQSALSQYRHILALDVFPALFFFLNGMTVTLTMRDRRISNRKLLSYMGKRGSVLLLIGLATCTIWPMNIFVATGLFYLITPFIAQWNNILLRIIALVAIILGVGIQVFGGYMSTFYDLPHFGAGEFIGICSFFLFNGYFSFLPWFAFFVAGMLHGRAEIRPRGFLPPSSVVGLALIAASFVVQYYFKKLDAFYEELPSSSIFIFNFRMLMPAFVTFGVGFSMVVTNALIYFFRNIERKSILRFVQTVSSQKYSVLFFHMLVGMITLISSNRPFFQKNLVLTLYVVMATFLTFYLTTQWRKRISEKGPVEWLVKRISGSAKS